MLVIAGPQTSNIFTGLAAGTYIIRVTDACGTFVDSANVVLANLTATPTITTSVAVDCSGSAIIGGFGAAGNGGPYSYSICNGAGCTSFGSYSTTSTFTVTTSGTYRISVQDRCGNTTSSADIVVIIPTRPTITGVNFTTACGPTTITPTLIDVPNTPYYSVDGSNFSPTIGTLAIGNHSIIVADYNAGTYSCASAPFNFTINTVAPTGTSPQSLSTTQTLADIVVVGTGIIWYASASDAALAINPLSNTTVVTNTTYYATQTISGCASTSSLPITIETFLSNNDFDLNSFVYYPNPVESILNFSYNKKLINVEVYNIDGKQIFTKKLDSRVSEVDMSKFATGIYFLKVYSETGFRIIKILKK